MNKIEKIVLKDKTIHLIFYSGVDIPLQLKRNKQKVFEEIQKLYF